MAEDVSQTEIELVSKLAPSGIWQRLPLRKLREIGQWVMESVQDLWHKDRPVFVLLCVWLALLLVMFLAVAVVKQVTATW